MLTKTTNCAFGAEKWRGTTKKGNSLDKLRHPRSEAYSAEQVLLNKQQICYPVRDLTDRELVCWRRDEWSLMGAIEIHCQIGG